HFPGQEDKHRCSPLLSVIASPCPFPCFLPRPATPCFFRSPPPRPPNPARQSTPHIHAYPCRGLRKGDQTRSQPLSPALAMPGLAAEQDAVSLVRRVARALNRRVTDIVALLFNHKSAGSLGAVAGFAIAVVFAWRFLRPSQGRPRRPAPKRPPPTPAAGATDSVVSDAPEPVGDSGKLVTRQIVAKRLSGCRKVTCQLLGAVFEEKTPEELQKHATVRPSVVELLLEISRHCDLYLMETVLDDKSEENALSALENAGLFRTGGLMKEKVLFCSTEVGRTSFVRQLEADFHIDTSLDIVSQLSRFIRCQLFISSMEGGQLAANIFNSPSLEQFFS
ncbi:unnamed protein product, partial [Urochloa humidicola]